MALLSTSLHKELASRGLVLLRGGQAHVALAVSMSEPGPGVPRDLPATQSLNPRVLTALAPMLPVMTRLSLIMMILVLLFETNVKRTTTSRSHPLYLRHVSHVESALRTEALPAHGESSGEIRRLSRSFSNFSLTDNRVVRSKTTGNLCPPFSLMRHHIRTGSQASQEELLPRGRIPGRSGGSLQVAVHLPLMPAILRAVLATFQVARHKVSVDKSLRSGTMHCPIATQPTLVEANLRPERLDFSCPHYLPLTLSSTLCFLSNHREVAN